MPEDLGLDAFELGTGECSLGCGHIAVSPNTSPVISAFTKTSMSVAAAAGYSTFAEAASIMAAGWQRSLVPSTSPEERAARVVCDPGAEYLKSLLIHRLASEDFVPRTAVAPDQLEHLQSFEGAGAIDFSTDEAYDDGGHVKA